LTKISAIALSSGVDAGSLAMTYLLQIQADERISKYIKEPATQLLQPRIVSAD
jgi:hypothetical protein